MGMALGGFLDLEELDGDSVVVSSTGNLDLPEEDSIEIGDVDEVTAELPKNAKKKEKNSKQTAATTNTKDTIPVGPMEVDSKVLLPRSFPLLLYYSLELLQPTQKGKSKELTAKIKPNQAKEENSSIVATKPESSTADSKPKTGRTEEAGQPLSKKEKTKATVPKNAQEDLISVVTTIGKNPPNKYGF
jgi:hypothetical protein